MSPCHSETLERRVLLDASPVGPEFRLNTFTTHHQDAVSVATDAHGNFVAAWQSWDQDGSGVGVYAQRYNAAGVPQGPEFRVNTSTVGGQLLPSAAMDADGDFVIAWVTSFAQGASPGVYAQRFDSAGVPQGQEFRVNTFTPGNESPPSAAMDADGDFVITWWGATGDDDIDVFARRFDAAGVPAGDVFRVNTFTPGGQSRPSVAMDADGDFVVAWNIYGQEGIGLSWGIYAQRYDSAGVPQGNEFHVNTYTPRAQENPAAAMDADGDFVITWTSENQDGSSNGVYGQRYDAAGVPQGPEFRVNSYTTNRQANSSVAMDAEGNVVITWDSFGQDGSLTGIYAQHYDATGMPRGLEFRVNSYTTSAQEMPSVAMDADGDFVVAWKSIGQDGSGYGVYAQRFTTNSDTIAPTVNSAAYQFELPPPAVTLQFSENVAASLAATDLAIENLTTMSVIDADQLSISYDTSTNTATIAFPGLPGGVPPDGDYRLTLPAGSIEDPSGNVLASDFTLDFFVLAGDANRDRRVNLADFNILATNFGQSGRTFSQGNFDYDPAGIVNLSDFNLLANRFGVTLGPQSSEGVVRSAQFSSRFGERYINDMHEDDELAEQLA